MAMSLIQCETMKKVDAIHASENPQKGESELLTACRSHLKDVLKIEDALESRKNKDALNMIKDLRNRMREFIESKE